jgi:raffinose/stachyose/melibiose transport system substrate-binding protein
MPNNGSGRHRVPPRTQALKPRTSEEGKMRTTISIRRGGRWLEVVLLSTLLGLAACSTASSPGGGGSSGKTTLTLWVDGAISGSPEVPLQVKDFEAAHPGVSIQTVVKPSANYFATLQAALISGKAPDLVSLYAGSYLNTLEPYLQDLNAPGQAIPHATLARIPDEAVWTKSGTVSSGTYAIPESEQFYNGYYNKALFSRAGITSLPQTWAQLYAACPKLKAIGVTPIVYGNDGNGGEFWPLAEWSYLLAGATPVSSWNGFLTGTQHYDSPEMIAQITAWARLYSSGCANSNALTDANNQSEFENGKAAMIIEGSWDTPIFQPHLGSDLGVFEPPYSTTGKHMIVELAGQGFGVPKSSPNKTVAEQFLASIVTSSGQKALVKTGQIPIYTGYTMPALSAELLETAASKTYQVYPMFDNYMQQPVATVANKVLDQAFVGQITPQAALQQIEAALQDLPASQRSATYPLGAP